MKFKLKKNAFLIISIVVFFIACSQKTYCTNGDCGAYWDGLAASILGAFGLFAGGAYIAWLANPLILISWLAYRKTKISLVTSILAFAFGLSFLLFDEIMVNEAGHYGEITGYEMGFYLWNLSFLIMIIGNVINLKNKSQ